MLNLVKSNKSSMMYAERYTVNRQARKRLAQGSMLYLCALRGLLRRLRQGDRRLLVAWVGALGARHRVELFLTRMQGGLLAQGSHCCQHFAAKRLACLFARRCSQHTP